MNADSYIKGELARFAITEAYGFGGSNNMLAVAYVIRSRVSVGWEGGDWLRVIETAGDVAGKARTPPKSVSLRDPAIKTLFQAIDDIYSGYAEDLYTEGALYYCDLTDARIRPWFRRHILRNLAEHPLCATVGPVSFFR